MRQHDLGIAVAKIERARQRHRCGAEPLLQIRRRLPPMRVAQQRRDAVFGAGRRGRDQRRQDKDRDRPPSAGLQNRRAILAALREFRPFFAVAALRISQTTY
jgi:hypothetical protein